jgi:hypothetical protein
MANGCGARTNNVHLKAIVAAVDTSAPSPYLAPPATPTGWYAMDIQLTDRFALIRHRDSIHALYPVEITELRDA